MRRYVFTFIGTAVLLAVTGALLLCMAVYNSKYTSAHNNADEAKRGFLSKIVRFEFPDGVVEVPMSEVGIYEVSIEMPGFFESLFDVPTTKIYVDWNKDALKLAIDDMYRDGVDASMFYTPEHGWEMIDDDFSRTFDVDAAYSEIAAQHPESVEVVDMEQYMQKPSVKSSDIIDLYRLRSKYNDFTLSYSSGEKLTHKELFPNPDSTPWDIETVDLSQLKSSLEEKYNTTNKVLDFTTTAGDRIAVPYKTYGKSVNWDKEKKEILSYIESGESCLDREPILRGYDNFDDTYIEIDIQSQHLWHYVDGELCCETDVITGLKNHNDTPTGVFYISECIPGKYLTGDTYKTWVNQWMRLTNSGVGLHDAYWKHKFGGNIYEYSGSHGCINLPPAFAKQLFSEVKNGYPVVIY